MLEIPAADEAGKAATRINSQNTLEVGFGWPSEILSAKHVHKFFSKWLKACSNGSRRCLAYIIDTIKFKIRSTETRFSVLKWSLLICHTRPDTVVIIRTMVVHKTGESPTDDHVRYEFVAVVAVLAIHLEVKGVQWKSSTWLQWHGDGDRAYLKSSLDFNIRLRWLVKITCTVYAAEIRDPPEDNTVNFIS